MRAPGPCGLPDGITACLFDLDGVLTQTARLHLAAWKQMFDDYLRSRDGDGFAPFAEQDYREYVDGKPRQDGTRDFLRSRGVELPPGSPDDPPEAETLVGLGRRKNDLLLQRIAQDGVETYDGSVAYLRAVRAAGLRTAVVSSSANTLAVLQATGIEELFDARIDAQVARERGLQGKPAPDTFLAGAAAVGVEPAHAAVFEDALAGVAAGHAGHFGYVVGVDRTGSAAALAGSGADVVVPDLSALLDAS